MVEEREHVAPGGPGARGTRGPSSERMVPGSVIVPEVTDACERRSRRTVRKNTYLQSVVSVGL